MTRWQRLAALTVEGLCFLPWLILRGGEFVALWRLATVDTPTLSLHNPLLWLIAISWLGQMTLLPPLKLGRLAWYCRLAAANRTPPLSTLSYGFRRWGSSLRWRGLLWWRRLTALAPALLPTALLWGWAHHTGHMGDTPTGLAWWGVGALVLPLCLGAALLWCGRTAPAGVLVLAGYPAGAAMSLAPRLMAGHRRAYTDLWGNQAGRLIGCVLLVPLPFLLPDLRLGHVRWLCRRVQEAAITPYPLKKRNRAEKLTKTQISSCKVTQSGVQ